MTELCERAGVTPTSRGSSRNSACSRRGSRAGERVYGESEADIALACATIARHGIDARHLRAFRTAAGRQSALLEQVVAPALRSRNAERRDAALDDLERWPPWRRSWRSCCCCGTCGRSQSDDGQLDLAALIRDVPDFPSQGIVFKDVMPLIADPTAFRETVDRLAAWAGPRAPDVILGAEARGFIFGGALAYALGCGFVTARKPGKLPWQTIEARYDLEYGTDSLEVHVDSIVPRPARDRPGRRARDRGHRAGEDRARRDARGHRRGGAVRDRAGVPERPGPPRRNRRARADRLQLTQTANTGVVGVSQRCFPVECCETPHGAQVPRVRTNRKIRNASTSETGTPLPS